MSPHRPAGPAHHDKAGDGAARTAPLGFRISDVMWKEDDHPAPSPPFGHSRPQGGASEGRLSRATAWTRIVTIPASRTTP